jgi:hypothetical protein
VASMDESDGVTVDVTERVPTADATQILPGDDITVVPDRHDGAPRRRATGIIGAVVAVVLIVGVIALATRDDDPNAAVATDASPTPSAETPAAAPTTVARVDKPIPTTVPVAAAPPASVAPPVPVPQNPVVVAPAPTVPAAPPTTIGTAPASSIVWTAPASVTVKTGKSTTIAVRAHNPAAGVISLPQPLSCAPTLDNSSMCTAVIQEIAPGQTATASWTVSAVGIAPGNYTLNFAGLLKIPVTVTA